VSSQRDDCAIGVDGLAYCWLPSDRIALPDTGPSVPRPVRTPVAVRDIFDVNPELTCVHAVDGRVLCRGYASDGLLGNGAVDQAAPEWTQAAGGRRFVSVATTLASMCGVTADGALQCWGRDDWGQLGMGTTAPFCVSPRSGGARHAARRPSRSGSPPPRRRAEASAPPAGRRTPTGRSRARRWAP
jgi:hypothetical protein